MPWGNDGNGPDNNDQGPWGRKPSSSTNNELDDLIKKGQDKFRKVMSDNGGSAPSFSPKVAILLLFIALLGWGATGFFIVEEGWRGVVLRFGEYDRIAGSGPNYHLPSPLETVIKVPADRVNTVEIGFSGSSANFGRVVERGNLNESLMLTGDENIVDVKLVVQWDIKSAPDFLFNVRDQNTVKSAAESAVREVVGSMSYRSAIAGKGRDKIAEESERVLQEILDDYAMGVNVRSVQIKQIDPPGQVIDAFRDVQTARADKEREINQAEAYRNDILPRAKGAAAQITQEAEAYKNEVVARAKGEAQRFMSVYKEYIQAKDITKQRMYLETMEVILAGTDKIIIDENSKSQGVVPYLPLPEIQKRRQ